MPLQDHHQIVSVDDHLIEHPRVWQDRLPQKYLEVGPRIEEVGDAQVWHFEDLRMPYLGLNAVAGKEPKDFGMEPVRYEDMIPGCYDPVERVKDMDVDGVQAALCFPSFPGFAGGVFQRAKDKELALECVKAWNDFQTDEWCATAPDRLIPLAILPTWDVELCVQEAQRMAAKGARTVTFPDSPVPLGLPSFYSDYWHPLWRTLEETQMPASLHFGSSSFVPGFSFQGTSIGPELSHIKDEVPFLSAIAVFATNLMWTTVDLLFSGALQKHPGLTISLAEGGIGWIPYILERADQSWEKHRWYQKVDFDTRPSELFRKHFYGCFIEDNGGLKLRHEIGVDRILMEIDYPHSDSVWPNSRKVAAASLQDIPDDEVSLIVEENARRMLRFPRTS